MVEHAEVRITRVGALPVVESLVPLDGLPVGRDMSVSGSGTRPGAHVDTLLGLT